jgi:Sap, sulfolipid-1-addressing protein
VSRVFFFALTAGLNPTLLTATTVMLLLERPKRLMLGYWLGAMTTGIVVGSAIVFSMSSSGVSTSQHQVAPGIDFAIGAILLLASLAVRRRSTPAAREERAAKRAAKPKKTPKWQQKLSSGTARTTFVIGLLLSFPGASYLASLDEIHKQGFSTIGVIATVIAVNLVMLVLLEVPLVGYTLAPDRTTATIERFKDWMARNGSRALANTLAVLGTALVIRAILEIFF